MLLAVNRSKGMLLLGLWVIPTGALPLLSLRIPDGSLLLTVLGLLRGYSSWLIAEPTPRAQPMP